jgi:hypothetical protein
VKANHISYVKVIAFIIGCLAIIIWSSDSRVQAIFAGALTFTINAGAVAFIAGKLFKSGGTEVAGARSRSSTGFLLLALLIKVFGLGLGIYLSLVWGQLSPSYFVVGALMVLLTVAAGRVIKSRPRNPKL